MPLAADSCVRVVFSLFLICVICGQKASAGEPGTIEALLQSVGVEPRDVGIRPNDLAFMVGTRPRSEFAHLLMCEPLRADGFARVLAADLVEGTPAHPVNVLGTLSRLNGRLVRRGLVSDPVAKFAEEAKQPGALARALELTEDDARLKDVPASVAQAAAMLLLTARDAAASARRGYPAPQTADERQAFEQLERRLHEPARTPVEEEQRPPEPDFDRRLKKWTEDFDTAPVMVAAQDLTFAAALAIKTMLADATLGEARFDIQVQTPAGWVVLADGRGQRHEYVGPILLLIDVGGNDTYANAGANFDAAHPLSIAIDLAGDDRYEAAADVSASFGAGIFGVGLLWDVAGNDVYSADHNSQGCGQFGAGLLIDGGGNDTYRAVNGSQAAALAGYGLLLDLAGDDRYEAYTESQAFAGPNATAALIDMAGNDRYVANDTDIRFPSAQNAQHNNSMCQAAACGWRADYSDGWSVNGGVALLLDAAGDDEYTCGLFGQGTGYWYGLGLLIDLAGADRYTGHWYVQGAAAHYAAGMLFDRAGNDQYTANQNMSQGAGHDLSVGVLIDDAGNDIYLGTTLGLGASNAAGVGIFVDKAGNDTYRTPPTACLGWANPNEGVRTLYRAYGLFFDLGGEDRYEPRNEGEPARPGPGNGRDWKGPPDQPAGEPALLGFGFDR